MKSQVVDESQQQVDALLHVLQGLHKDAIAAYPALEEEFVKDFDRLALYCRTRGLGVFTLDLPHLESLLLKGLDAGRLVLEGPLSTRKSKSIHVPRLYSGLWLRVFDERADLRQDVDVTAIAFLRQLLVIGKKIEVVCSYDRIQATVGAYHDIERKLRSPSLSWACDSLGILGVHHRGVNLDDERDSVRLLPLSSSSEEERGVDEHESKEDTSGCTPCATDNLGLAQAVEATEAEEGSIGGGLFESEPVDPKLRLQDYDLLNQIQRVADLIVGSMSVLDPVGYSANLEEEGRGIGFKHGPGAVAERRKNWEKSQFLNWTDKLQSVFPFELCGRTAFSDVDRPHNHEVPSRLIWVPKDAKRPRLIAAEPTSHQWCQQLVLKFLMAECGRLFRGYFIDFKDQSKSGDMVIAASRDGSMATVDLSDASDRLTCWTVERVFRSNRSILLALHAARTRYLRDDISEVPGFLSLKKFASQGTAVTFPVMSIVMLCIALGACLKGPVTWRAIWRLCDQVRVFGDDIIVPTHGYVRLIRAMELLQLKVNVAKSYNNGLFRESCGTDGYLGYDVTPVKPKVIVADSPASCQAVVDNSNNLFNKGYWNASTACLDLLPVRLRRRIRIVGPYDAGFRGLSSYSGGDESHLTTRWNSRLHRYEVRVWGLSLRTLKRPREGQSAMLDFFASVHNHEHARIVSEYADVRKTRVGLLWEPLNTHARVSLGYVRERRRRSHSKE